MAFSWNVKSKDESEIATLVEFAKDKIHKVSRTEEKEDADDEG